MRDVSNLILNDKKTGAPVTGQAFSQKKKKKVERKQQPPSRRLLWSEISFCLQLWVEIRLLKHKH